MPSTIRSDSDTVMLRNTLAKGRVREITLPYKPVFTSRVLPARPDSALILELENQEGITGMGEAVLWGETAFNKAHIMSSLQEILPRLITFSYDSPDNIDSSVTALMTWYRRKQESQDTLLTESALITSALLHLLSQEKNIPLVELLGPMTQHAITYTGIVPLAGRGMTLSMMHTLTHRGVKSVKLKMGRDLDKELKLLRELTETYAGQVTFIVDFDGRLSREAAPDLLESLLSLGITAVEQPLPPDDIEATRAMMEAFEDELMFGFDQSAVTSHDIDTLMSTFPKGYITLSIPKNGGWFTCNKFATKVTKGGWQATLGATPGESSLSVALTRILAAKEELFTHCEGTLPAQFLTTDLTLEPLGIGTFGEGSLEQLQGTAGYGFPISPNAIKGITRKTVETPFL